MLEFNGKDLLKTRRKNTLETDEVKKEYCSFQKYR